MAEESDIIPIHEIKKLSQKAMSDNIDIMNALAEYDKRESDTVATAPEAYQSNLVVGMNLLSPGLLERLTIVGNVG